MRFLFGILLMIGGLCGTAMSIMSNIVVDSSLFLFDGLEPSFGLAVFSIVAFFSGLFNMVSTN